MARREIVVLQDDLDGSEKDVRVVKFGFEGVSYEIDLSPSNFDKLAKALDPFVAVARKDVKRSAAGSAPRSKGLSAAEQRAFNQRVRDWAKAQKGTKVSERGRVPAKLIEAYHAAGLR